MKKTSNEMRFETQIPLREVMKTNPTMIGIEATVAKAAKTMCHDEVGSVIILSDSKPIGIVTEEDITCKVVAKDLKPSTCTCKRHHEYATHYGECGQNCWRRGPYDGEA